ncbi:MAG: hypothetical protein KGM98_11160, partial [Bacteroidota bacterium]|nr:hypothetical protein [Bacteroidota bacterium]
VVGVGVGVILANYLFIPWFSEIANFDLSEILFSNATLWIAIPALIILIVIGSAAYPSFYISSTRPVSLVKGKMVLASKNRLRKFLLGFQFFLTFLGLSMALAFVRENQLSRAKPWGYHPDNTVVVSLNGPNDFEVFQNQLKNNPEIISVTGSAQPLGNWSKQMLIKAEGKETTTLGLQVLPGFASQLGIQILKGRDLSEKYATDQASAVLVNHAFLRSMHWSTGMGKIITYDGHPYQIVGETNDFHFENFKDLVKPCVLMGSTPGDVKFAYVQMKPGRFKDAHTLLSGIWRHTFPDLPFDSYYQDGVFDNYFNGFTQVSRVLVMTSLIMIVISMTGIFGLALLILGKKMKDISIRKVLGAGSGSISFQILKEFLSSFGISIILGMPVSYWLTQSILNQAAPDSHVSFLPMAITLVGLITMIFISVVWHLYKAYVASPTYFLKAE